VPKRSSGGFLFRRIAMSVRISGMTSRLPPLRAIEIFVVAGRSLSFTDAAKAVNLTPSAVSRRMRALEAELGTALFHRFNRRLELTAVGARYLEAMSRAIDLIQQESDSLRPHRPEKVLRLSTVPLLGAWLMPRLAELKRRRPDLDIQISASGEVVDLSEGRFDAAVRFGDGRWPGLVADHLLAVVAFPVAAPGLLPTRLPASAAALDRTVLFDLGRAPQLWPQWFESVGLNGYRPPRVQTFDSAEVMYRAAINGLGLALGYPPLIEEHLAAGRLVPVFDNEPVVLRQSYYLVYRRALRDRPAMRALARALHGDKTKPRLR
jgi:LysR family glycine cleavage system transcriptional activator